MKINTILATLLILVSYSFCLATDCAIPVRLKKELAVASKKVAYSEEDFSRINSLLFEYDDRSQGLRNCTFYKKNISELFRSENQYKRLVAYRLIGFARDSSFNSSLIERINSDESSLLKTWSAVALMANKTPNSSDHLFKLFSSCPEGLPVDILIGMYVDYDSSSVKKTCWKFIDSKIKNEQILSVQCLASYERSDKLALRLFKFLDSWDMESKGWVISAMSMQRIENLKPVLEKYSKIEELQNVIIRALEKSPTKSDNEFAQKLSLSITVPKTH